MSPDVRRTALRAAAKVAIIVTLGCGGGGGAQRASSEPEPDLSGNEPGSCADYLDSLATVDDMQQLPEGDPLRDAPGAYGAFSDIEARNSARTRECCTEEIVARGSDAAHRWECCSALGDVPEGANQTACTPWGPPCPPEMPV